MAKILYGVCGQGAGHSSRSSVIIEHLLKKGHKVKVITHSQGYKNLKNRFDVEEISGARLIYEHNKVNYIKTVFAYFLDSPHTTKSIIKVWNIMDKFNPDIVFTDFEPISCYVANLKQLPVVSIDNQHILTKSKISYPAKYKKEAIVAKAITMMTILKSKAYLATTFFYTKPLSDKLFEFPPILRKEIIDSKAKKGDYILVYFTSPYNDIIKIFKSINKKFIVYGFNKNEKDKNIIFKVRGKMNSFLKDLANCEAIIANSGFTLIGEALHLGKPYLAVPVEKQFEQVLNAYYLEKLGYGKYYDKLNKKKIEDFLRNLPKYEKNLSSYPKEDNSKIFKKIDQLIIKYSH